MEKEIKVYEYVTTCDWIQSVEKGCRFYYDLNKGVYEFHTETDNNDKNEYFLSHYVSSRTVTLHPHIVERLIEQKRLEAGPELGELIPPTKAGDPPNVTKIIAGPIVEADSSMKNTEEVKKKEESKEKVIRWVDYPEWVYLRNWYDTRERIINPFLYWF